MEEIREQKQKNNNKNLKHCIYTRDNDIILLSLLIHEPNILILKEEIMTKNNKNDIIKEKNFLNNHEFVYISVLREYLDIEFCKLKNKIKFQYNIERFYDDYALLCLLVGNDFIPGLMELDSDGSVYEFLLTSYKKDIEKCKDYLTENGKINFHNFHIFINELSSYEKEYLNLKYSIFERQYYSKKNRIKESSEINKEEDYNTIKNVLKEKLKTNNEEIMKKINDLYQTESTFKLENSFLYKFINEYNHDKYEGKKFYYQKQFSFDIEDEDKSELKSIIINYLEGLQWNLFYYKGFLNWNWNYIYNTNPLLSDVATFSNIKNAETIICENIFQLKGEPLPPYILQCLVLSPFFTIPSAYKKIKEIIPDYYEYENLLDIGIPNCPKINKKMIKKLIEFDNSVFKKTNNYELIKKTYGKEYLYNTKLGKKEYNRKRFNDIFYEDYENKKTDFMFPSIENINNYKYIEGYFNRVVGKNKIITINSLFIYLDLEEKKNKKINKIMINNMFKEKIISYGYPLIKLGIFNGLYYNNKRYSLDEEAKTIKETVYQFDYEELIKKDYEYIGLKFLNISCLVEVIPIIYIDMGNFVYDYDYTYLIPLEITSLNEVNNIHKQYIKNVFKKKFYIQLNKDLIEKEKEVFLYDESLKKNKSNDIKDNINVNNKKNRKGSMNGNNKFDNKKKSLKLSIEREIQNFKFKDIDDIYY